MTDYLMTWVKLFTIFFANGIVLLYFYFDNKNYEKKRKEQDDQWKKEMQEFKMKHTERNIK